MTTADAPQFEAALDRLADVLQTDTVTREAMAGYFKSLRGFELTHVMRSCAWLRDNHKPMGRIFPVPADFKTALDATHADAYTGRSRSKEEIDAEFARRGMRVLWRD